MTIFPLSSHLDDFFSSLLGINAYLQIACFQHANRIYHILQQHDFHSRFVSVEIFPNYLNHEKQKTNKQKILKQDKKKVEKRKWE